MLIFRPYTALMRVRSYTSGCQRGLTDTVARSVVRGSPSEHQHTFQGTGAAFAHFCPAPEHIMLEALIDLAADRSGRDLTRQPWPRLPQAAHPSSQQALFSLWRVVIRSARATAREDFLR